MSSLYYDADGFPYPASSASSNGGSTLSGGPESPAESADGHGQLDAGYDAFVAAGKRRSWGADGRGSMR